MRALRVLTWTETKLFVREPLTVVFTLGLPLVWLAILGGVFGNVPNHAYYRGVGPMDFYAPAYVALVVASMGLIGLPAHLAGYRERGVLRRFRASALSVWVVLGSQLAVTVLLSALGVVAVVGFCVAAYGSALPVSWSGVALALALGTLAFAALGVLLGAVFPTARAAQGAGVLLWFVAMILGGAGPPPDALTPAMRTVATFTPLTHLTRALQDPWLGFGGNLGALAVVAATLVASVGLTARFFRWE